MMIVDSATPMFTSEFNFIGGPGVLAVGGLESTATGAGNFHHQAALINEWNPVVPIPDATLQTTSALLAAAHSVPAL